MEAIEAREYADELEQAEAEDPGVGEGSPASAPHWMPFDADLELDGDGAAGAADDGDDDGVEDSEDDGAPIDDDI